MVRDLTNTKVSLDGVVDWGNSPHPPAPDAAVEAEVLERFVAAGVAPNTKKALVAGWDAWEKWATARGSHVFPARGWDVAVWLCWLRERGNAASTVRLRRWAVAAKHKDAGLPDPTRERVVVDALKGIGRVDAANTWQAAPLRGTDFSKIIETTNVTKRAGCRDLAMLAVMRDGMLRGSEVCAVRWCDITVRNDGLGVLLIRRSKTDQEGVGWRRLLSEVTMKFVLDWQAWRRVELSDGVIDEQERMFGLKNYAGVTARLELRGRYAKLHGLTSHSVRVGAAQDLAEAGMSLPQIMQIGRWKSSTMVARYIEHLVEKGSGSAGVLSALV